MVIACFNIIATLACLLKRIDNARVIFLFFVVYFLKILGGFKAIKIDIFVRTGKFIVRDSSWTVFKCNQNRS